MSGGIWTTQNKVLPDAYINFKGVSKPQASVGSRGIITAPMALSWGPEGELIEVTSEKFFESTSLPIIGLTAYDSTEQAIRIREALKYAPKGLFYRLSGVGSAKATKVLITGEDLDLTATAKYNGDFGNRISVGIALNRTVDTVNYYDVTVYVDGIARAKLANITTIDQIVNSTDNGYVTFSATGDPELAAVSPVNLTGGLDGTVSESVSGLVDYFTLIGKKKWNCMAIPFNVGSDLDTLKTKIKAWRDSGLKAQIAVWSADEDNVSNAAADYEGIIQTDGQGYATKDDEIVVTPEAFLFSVAGMTAGASVNESNSCKKISGAVRIIRYDSNGDIVDGSLSKTDLENKLNSKVNGTKAGYFCIHIDEDDSVIVAKDINTFSSFVSNYGYDFSKNRIIREIDQTDSDISALWRKSYAGKVSNNEDSRNVFKGEVQEYFKELEKLSIVEKIDDENLITLDISQGLDKDAVVVGVFAKYTDSMEILYLNVNCM